MEETLSSCGRKGEGVKPFLTGSIVIIKRRRETVLYSTVQGRKGIFHRRGKGWRILSLM